jgi:hypothetical protein
MPRLKCDCPDFDRVTPHASGDVSDIDLRADLPCQPLMCWSVAHADVVGYVGAALVAA